MKNYFSYILKSFTILTLFLILVFSCSKEKHFWIDNGTILKATKFKIALSDSSKILMAKNHKTILLSPADSLVLNKFILKYSKLDSNANRYFLDNSNQQITSSINSNIIQYYKVENDKVLFVGYSKLNTDNLYTVFEPPLTISLKNNEETFTSTGIMKTFNYQKKSFDKGFNAKLEVRILNKVSLLDDNKTLSCLLRQITLSRDAKYAYGNNNLVLPDAVIMRTNLLTNKEGIPIAEWSIRLEHDNSKLEHNSKEDSKYYIEFIKYSKK